jgi:hypothetical protein
LAEPGTIGFRELPELSPEEAITRNQEKRANALAALQARKASLMTELSTTAPPASDELQRLQHEVDELERIKAEQQNLEDRDERRRQKDIEFKARYVDRPPPKYVPEQVVTRTEETKSKKAQAKEEFLRNLAESRETKAKRQEEKKSEGASRQAKAEEKSKKRKGHKS